MTEILVILFFSLMGAFLGTYCALHENDDAKLAKLRGFLSEDE